MRRRLMTLLLLPVLLAGFVSSALALDGNYDFYYDGNAPEDGVYSHAASYLYRDWILRDCLDFGMTTRGSLMKYTGGRGIFADFNLGMLIVTDEERSVVMPVVGFGSVSLEDAVGTIADYAENVTLIRGADAPGLVPEEDQEYGWYYAMGIAATAGLHMDTMPPVYMQADGGWRQLTQEEQAQVLFMTSWMAHTYLTTAYIAYPAEGDEDGVSRTLIDLQANHFMRQAMIDCETGAAAELGLTQPGAWVVRADGDLYLLISDGETYWAFWFQPKMDPQLLTGYAVMAFLMMGYDPWTYDLTYIDGESRYLLDDSDKNAAISAYYRADYEEQQAELLNKE